MGLNQTKINSFGNKNDPYFKKIYTSFEKSIALESNLPEWVLNLDGLSGKKYRHMINNLIALIKKPRYLEIGSWKGSTSCAAAIENILCITCILVLYIVSCALCIVIWGNVNCVLIHNS